MPQAPSWLDLEKWEDAFEPACKAVLVANGVARAYITRTDETIQTPCVLIEFTLGEADRHAGVRVSDGEIFLDVYRAKLSLTIITDRATNDDQDADNTDSHSDIRAKCRVAMRKISNWTVALLPYHQVTEIMPTGTSPQITAESDQDLSELTFSMVVSVRADAWPED